MTRLIPLLLALIGCATAQTPTGRVLVVKEPPGGELCKYLAALQEADQVAATVGVVIACGQAAADDECLMRHEQVHVPEQRAHKYGPLGWIADWKREYAACLRQGRSVAECHEAHSMEQSALVEQRECEAERDARGGS